MTLAETLQRSLDLLELNAQLDLVCLQPDEPVPFALTERGERQRTDTPTLEDK